ncbi:hypothetical protein EX352_21270 [Klebsiella pneumoniae]|nr:hypothetical protein EX352_21270 [Klebsiella pneumoniae]QBH07962.1 hypothetical protein EYB55_11320 [Klebsiella pneumoniae]
MLPGGGCALPGLQDPLTGSHSVGPRKRSAAGRWYQARYPWCCRVAAAPYPAYRILSQAHTPQARASVAPPGDGIRHDSRDFAGRRLAPYPAYWILSQAHTP